VQVSFRKAELSDVPLLKRWDSEPHNILADPEFLDWEEILQRKTPWEETLIALEGTRPVGVVQIIDPAREESHYWGHVAENLRAIDIWIGEVKDLRRGLGTQMMHLALERCFGIQEVQGVLIDPLVTNTGAQLFYQSMGFRALGERLLEGDLCLVMRLEREEWTKANLTHL
jgi:aminoglycoside 6'-N-acetyltransferase